MFGGPLGHVYSRGVGPVGVGSPVWGRNGERVIWSPTLPAHGPRTALHGAVVLRCSRPAVIQPRSVPLV